MHEIFERELGPATDLSLVYEDMVAQGIDETVTRVRALLGLNPRRKSIADGRYEKQARPEDIASIADIHSYLTGAGPLPMNRSD